MEDEEEPEERARRRQERKKRRREERDEEEAGLDEEDLDLIGEANSDVERRPTSQVHDSWCWMTTFSNILSSPNLSA